LSLYVQDFKKYPLFDGLEGSSPGSVLFWDGLVLPYMSNDRLAFSCPANQLATPWINALRDAVSREIFPNSSYGYNYSGTGFFPEFLDPLGLDGGNSPLRESRVLVPNDMVAICDYKTNAFDLDDDGDDFPMGNILSQLTSFHNKGANAVFCEGHVEYGKQRAWTKPTAEARQRWNSDHQPHRSTWNNDPD
jgi:hypothetical protein